VHIQHGADREPGAANDPNLITFRTSIRTTPKFRTQNRRIRLLSNNQTRIRTQTAAQAEKMLFFHVISKKNNLNQHLWEPFYFCSNLVNPPDEEKALA
jgi:hypothetical protein